ncbi:MAG: hypothetical protein MUE71_05985 [Chitinophagaceae bacterium]|nr:hypothetical protein [Chitinophagaceae bacterium]
MQHFLYKLLLYIYFALLTFISSLSAQETLRLSLNKEQFLPGENIEVKISVPEWENTSRLGTVNLLIQSATKEQIWKLRYPIVDGYFDATLLIPDSFPPGRYFFTAELQPLYFQLTGKLRNHAGEDSLRYTMQLQDKSLIAGVVKLDKEGAFRFPRHTFSGRASLFFSAYKPTKGKNRTDVSIVTRLDSAYKPIAHASISALIGTPPANEVLSPYQPDSNLLRNLPSTTLEDVVVTGKYINKAENVDEKVSSGYFKGDRAYLFSGLDGEFSGFVNILDFLVGRVAGLNISRNTDELTQYLVTWRNEPTAFFIDEMPVDLDAIVAFPPNELAYIKVFPPPFMGVVLGSGGGAIALYTKRATLGMQSRYQNRFVIQGYSHSNSILKVYEVKQKKSAE